MHGRTMRETNNLIRLFLCLLFAVSSVYCSRKPASECDSKKMQLLLEDILKKKEYFPVYKIWTESLSPKVVIPPDSTIYFGYLFPRNINIPDKQFYLKWDKELEPSYPDSVKLKTIKDFSEMDAIAYAVDISILEVNADSTKMKIKLKYGPGRRIFDSGTFNYLFDEKNCKWTVLDSTIKYSDY